MDESQRLDALVIGAGPAGIGTAAALASMDDLVFGVIERGEVGESFLQWPARQTFLTPSFTGNGFGATDLNAIHPETSPAFSLGVDYPTGRQYADYLRRVAQHFRLPIMTGTEVGSVTPSDDGFVVVTSRGKIYTRSVVWAGGEFHDPIRPPITGGELLDHARDLAAWRQRPGHLVILGGYESGIDLACHHVSKGSAVTVVDPNTPWDAGTGSDPSFLLAPRSPIRLAKARKTGRLTLIGQAATAVGESKGFWEVELRNGQRLRSDSTPLAATGYGPGLGPVAALFRKRSDGLPELDEDDQSTVAPGLFLSGPTIRHGGMKFCFIYKFRQRFAHIARLIGQRADKDVRPLELWSDAGMLTDDLSCCAVECAC